MQIKIINLMKKYGNSVALKNITFRIEDKTITALLGPNGAGKTTTINILAGLLKPDDGEIYYGDLDFLTNSNKIKSIIGLVPQYNNIDKDLTLYQNLLIHSILFGVKKNEIKNRIEEILNFTGLTNHKNKEAGKLSGGMKRRLVIGRAILHRPKILFLDEPTVGLDPATRRHIWDFVKNINKNFGCTVVLTTHYIEEAELLSDYVYFIDKGEIIKHGKPENLKNEMGKYALEIFIEGKTREEYFESKTEAIERLKQLTYVDMAKIREVNLEDVYLKLTGKKIDI
ncbi:ABC transporter ATP-binding protein [Calditerrivibrio nitroreducens]|uniref:ABC transporter related protein n=1 Tax=Calditerrivibrio nitroreducens (strain DSM 19672 / NBRC 101217 / Yu37-1) TaxID=768670 RepID=E4TKC7_CALNY|nr:ABC transporter ATP-binding protein [Calditerrivibrio nitroreducens]ADR19999.1 ABC transporter related protein [Calditerrivibrio nitroreducens DSM 19672]